MAVWAFDSIDLKNALANNVKKFYCNAIGISSPAGALCMRTLRSTVDPALHTGHPYQRLLKR
jgi:hypothetical protein